MNPQKFSRIAESLRQYRRAELRDFEQELGNRPVDSLYVDPLPEAAVLNSVMSGNTTYLLGRKGTGKSTVFAKAQGLLRERRDLLSIYIDVKSLYDIVNSAEVPARTVDADQIDIGVCRAHLLRKAFLGGTIAEILREVDRLMSDLSLWDVWIGKKKSFEGMKAELSTLQSKVRQTALERQELPVLQQITSKCKSRKESEQTNKRDAKVGASIGATGPKASIGASVADFDRSLSDNELYNEYSDVVLRSFPFAEIISKIQELLTDCNLKKLVIFFDDFSELSLLDQRLFVDVVLAPLNNSSNETIKLKIAGYPGRAYYGRIDATKVDTICLDFAALYEAVEVQSMEASAVEYAERLLTTRFTEFGENITDYFDSTVALSDHMRLMFEVTFNVPRLMGAVLHTCYLDRVSKGLQITAAAMRLAARKYYETTIAQYFDRLNRFALEPFENKLDRHNQRGLLMAIVEECRVVRRQIADGSVGGSYFGRLTNPPTSHFLVNPGMAEIFSALESNFLVSKYKDTRDKDGKAVTVFALNYGLVEAERLAWGYPPGRDYRNYFVQRCFDFTSIIHRFLSRNQTIRCDTCAKCFPLEQRPGLELYGWRCPECRDGTCSIVNLADDYRNELTQLAQDLLLEETELEILNALDSEARPMRAGEIAALIDVTYQRIGHRTSKLRDLGLVEKRASEFDGNMRSEITQRARETYFAEDLQSGIRSVAEPTE
jgi:DNA-binding transcriptional ArsR family regulator